MSPRHDPTRPRHELKYVVPHATARALLAELADVMAADPHSGADGYRVRSLYFDTPGLAAYFEKLDGVDPRFKVRLRRYGIDGGACFLEIKHRRGQLIHKERLRLSSDAVDALSDTAVLAPDLDALGVAADAPGRARVEQLLASPARVPICTVEYRRLAFVTRIDPSLRLTIDVDLRAGPPASLVAAISDGMTFLPHELCVVELKFHWAIPLWLVSLTRSLGMTQRRYSKYASALEALRPESAHREVRLASTR